MTDDTRRAPTTEPGIRCEACEAGYRLAETGIHYNDANGGWTWGVCRKVVEWLRRERLREGNP